MAETKDAPDEKAEERNKKHVMTIVNDILPRMGYDVEEYFKKRA